MNEVSYIEKALNERRSLEDALADLMANCSSYPTPERARMIQQLEAEIAERRRQPKRP
jgi:hypothetical protein